MGISFRVECSRCLSPALSRWPRVAVQFAIQDWCKFGWVIVYLTHSLAIIVIDFVGKPRTFSNCFYHDWWCWASTTEAWGRYSHCSYLSCGGHSGLCFDSFSSSLQTLTSTLVFLECSLEMGISANQPPHEHSFYSIWMWSCSPPNLYRFEPSLHVPNFPKFSSWPFFINHRNRYHAHEWRCKRQRSCVPVSQPTSLERTRLPDNTPPVVPWCNYVRKLEADIDRYPIYSTITGRPSVELFLSWKAETPSSRGTSSYHSSEIRIFRTR